MRNARIVVKRVFKFFVNVFLSGDWADNVRLFFFLLPLMFHVCVCFNSMDE